jgi:hypothetical protein
MLSSCNSHDGDKKCKQNFSRNIGKERAAGRHWHRWEGNIKLDLKEVRCEVVE